MMRRALQQLRAERDAGMTLTELIVAMGIFMAVLAVFGAAIVSMSQTTVRAQATSDSASQVRTVFQRMDKEIRYASDINPPGVSGGDYYVEYLVPVSTGNAEPLCVQWRLSAGERLLERRTWDPADPASATDWLTMITDVRNDLNDSDQEPFTLLYAGADGQKAYMHQRLDVYLDSGMGEARDGRGSQLDVTFVALNSSEHSVTNYGSDTVCLGGSTQRP